MIKKNIRVMQIIDTLDAGGAERMAVNLANQLAKQGCDAYLCASRYSGVLEQNIQPDVTFLVLNRKTSFDLGAVVRLVDFVKNHRIQILHAHSSSLAIAAVTCWLTGTRLIYHDHSNGQSVRDKNFLYTVAFYALARQAAVILSVTHEFADWVNRMLRFPSGRAQYLPNFIDDKPIEPKKMELPGVSGKRLVCVANIRPQKDPLTLLQAMQRVVQSESEAHLILVGAARDVKLAKEVKAKIISLGLASHVTWLGLRSDIPDILANCDIGLLTSVSEGFPVTLLEYGQAHLAVVATEVGECAEILDHGLAGLVVPPSQPPAMSESILLLLRDYETKTRYAEKLSVRVKETYSAQVVVNKLVTIYESLL